jgi:hypothetical protein
MAVAEEQQQRVGACPELSLLIPSAASSPCRLSLCVQYSFGPWPISAEEVFAKTQLSYAFVNLKPIVPGEMQGAVAAAAAAAHTARGTF